MHSATLAFGLILVGACGGVSRPNPPARRLPTVQRPTGSADTDDASQGATASVSLPTLPTPTVLVSLSERPPLAVAVDETSVYWLDGQRLARLPKQGGPPEALYPAEDLGRGEASRIVVDGAHIYSTSDSTDATEPGVQLLRGMEKKTHAVANVVSLRGAVLGCLTADEQLIYWAQDNAILRVPKAGGRPRRIAAGRLGWHCFAVDESRLYIPQEHTIIARPKGGGPSTTLVRGVSAAILLVDDTHLYWIDREVIRSAPKAGGQPVESVRAGAGIGRMAVDDSGIYFTVPERGEVVRLEKDGGARTVLAENQNHPTEVATDRASVYWSVDNGVAKLAKR
jgi:hypothetical protein